MSRVNLHLYNAQKMVTICSPDKKYHYSEKFLENVGNFVLIMNDQYQEKSDKIEKRTYSIYLLVCFC